MLLYFIVLYLKPIININMYNNYSFVNFKCLSVCDEK